MEEEFSMSSSIEYPDMYDITSDDVLIVVKGIYVDESLNTGTPIFEKLTSESLMKLDSKQHVFDLVKFFGRTVPTDSHADLSFPRNGMQRKCCWTGYMRIFRIPPTSLYAGVSFQIQLRYVLLHYQS